ncbi:MAG: hypothetical protein FWG96_06655 [Methanomassiliicoccaceae archaeon]|nr:hypothetical protein [Methanomassiliicoccaceae archaeon]
MKKSNEGFLGHICPPEYSHNFEKAVLEKFFYAHYIGKSFSSKKFQEKIGVKISLKSLEKKY